VELCKACGFNYRDMERDDGVLLAVAEANCRYKFPARFDDQVTVRSWIEEANTRMVTFQYEMSAEGKVLATGFTRHIYVSREMQRVRLPDKYRALFGIPEPAAPRP
jgi:acyl-CoA thioester hydrolase